MFSFLTGRLGGCIRELLEDDLALYPPAKWKDLGWDFIDTADLGRSKGGLSYLEVPNPSKGQEVRSIWTYWWEEQGGGWSVYQVENVSGGGMCVQWNPSGGVSRMDLTPRLELIETGIVTSVACTFQKLTVLVQHPTTTCQGYPRLLVENRVYSSRVFRKLHLEVAHRQDGLQVLHMVLYPR